MRRGTHTTCPCDVSFRGATASLRCGRAQASQLPARQAVWVPALYRCATKPEELSHVSTVLTEKPGCHRGACPLTCTGTAPAQKCNSGASGLSRRGLGLRAKRLGNALVLPSPSSHPARQGLHRQGAPSHTGGRHKSALISTLTTGVPTPQCCTGSEVSKRNTCAPVSGPVK